MFNYLIDLRDSLKKGPGKWQTRELTDIQHIVIHQALGAKATAEGVNSYHIASTAKGIAYGRGWPRIAYHFFIERNGDTKWCNDLTDIVWHAKGANTNGIGICVAGNFAGEGHEPDNPLPAYQFNEPTEQQINSLEILVPDLIAYLNLDITALTTHSKFGKPACPGFVLEDWVNQFKVNS